MANTASDVSKIPDHVPEELVFQWSEVDFPDYETDPYGVIRALAKEQRPIFWTPNDIRSNNGAWVVTSAAYCREVLQQPDPFTTTIRYANDNASWPRRLIPLMMDPPEHTSHRRLIASIFSPKNIDSQDEYIREVVNEVIDGFAKQGQVDFMKDFARVFPGVIFMRIMGLPIEMKERFFHWEEKFFHDGTDEEKQQVGIEIAQYLQQLIEEKRVNPGDDLVSSLIDSEIDGEQLSDEVIQDFCFLMYIAGLDTVNGGLGHIFRWLADHPEEQQQLRENPERITVALEELLRIHSWIDMSRVLSRDFDFHGVKMKAGDRVVVNTPAASWDEARHECPFDVDLDREINPHLAFGGGPHRCAGSYLARRELSVAMAEWLRRIPQFEVTPGEEVTYFTDGLLSLRNLPLSWDGSEAQ